MRQSRLVAAALFLCSGTSSAQIVYSNNFDFNTNGVSGPVGVIAYPGGCTSAVINCAGRYLGASDLNPLRLNQVFSIALGSLPAHTSLRLSFDYLVLHSMDGSAFGPDGVKVVADGTTLLEATFSNWPTNQQNYCPPVSIGTSFLCTRWTGATEVNTLGYTFQGDVGSSLYQFALDLTHVAPNVTYTFTAMSNQDWTDEGMGFDNIRVEAIGAVPGAVVPEPGTCVLFATGLVGVFGGLRRRRASARGG